MLSFEKPVATQYVSLVHILLLRTLWPLKLLNATEARNHLLLSHSVGCMIQRQPSNPLALVHIKISPCCSLLRDSCIWLLHRLTLASDGMLRSFEYSTITEHETALTIYHHNCASSEGRFNHWFCFQTMFFGGEQTDVSLMTKNTGFYPFRTWYLLVS